MGKVTVRMNPSGARAVMNSAGAQAELLRHASRVATGAAGIDGGDYYADVRAGMNRAHARAKTRGVDTIFSNRKHNSLLKALGGR